MFVQLKKNITLPVHFLKVDRYITIFPSIPVHFLKVDRYITIFPSIPVHFLKVYRFDKIKQCIFKQIRIFL
jgi:hypothetical protein